MSSFLYSWYKTDLHEPQEIHPAFPYSHESNFLSVLAPSRHHRNPTVRIVSLEAPSTKLHCSSTPRYTVLVLEEQEHVKDVHGEFERRWL